MKINNRYVVNCDKGQFKYVWQLPLILLLVCHVLLGRCYVTTVLNAVRPVTPYHIARSCIQSFPRCRVYKSVIL